MATISSKLLVQLPALLFSVFAIVMSRQALSNDHITTYKYTPKNSEPFRVVIRERIINGVHLYLSRIHPDAEAGEATHHSVTGVMALYPDPNRSGRYVVRELSPYLETIPGGSSFTGSGSRNLYGVIMPSQRDLNQLLSSAPATGEDGNLIRLALPIPQVHIPVQWGGASQAMELIGDIRNPEVAASENNTVFTVTGYTWGSRRPEMSCLTGKSVKIEGVKAILTQNPEDGGVQLQEFEIGGYLAIEREGFEEGGEPDEIFNDYWGQLEEYLHERAKDEYMKKKYQEFYLRLSESDREMMDFDTGEELFDEERARFEELHRQLDAFMESAGNAYTEPESITAGGEPGNSTADGEPENNTVDGELEDGTADLEFEGTVLFPEVSI